MTLHRINWQTAASTGARVGRCILIAGFPHAIVPEGQEVTAVTWTGDSDPAWHPGASPTCKAWLLMRSEHGTDVPSLAWEENASPVQGTVDVGSLAFHLASTDDGPTDAFGAEDDVAFTRLVGDHSASATTITVESTDAFPSSGALHVGRERVTYSGKTSTTFTGCTRGTAGTKARPYKTRGALFRVYDASNDRLPSLVGRRLTVWAYRLSDAGEATDPTLVYDGRVTADAGVNGSSAWQVTAEHALLTLDAKSDPPTLALYGYHHGNTVRDLSVSTLGGDVRAPLVAWWTDPAGTTRQLSLNSNAGDPDHEGWSPTRERYLERWNRAARAGSFSVEASLRADGILQVSAADGVDDRRLTAWFGWTETTAADPADEGDSRATATVYSTGAELMPEACFWLDGKVYLDATAAALMPAAPTYPLSDAVTAWWTLTAKRRNGSVDEDEVTSLVRVPGAASATPSFTGAETQGVYCEGFRGTAAARGRNLGLLFTRPATATLGLFTQGPRWWSVLRYGVLEQVDTLRGLDQIADSVAWDRVAAVATSVHGFGTVREYVVDLAGAPLDILRNEARLAGLALSTWHGRVSVAACSVVAATEASAATLTSAHLREGETATLTTSTDGLATSYKLNLTEDDSITVNDAGAIAEGGAHDTVEADLPALAIADGVTVASPAVHEAVINVAATVLGAFARPYRVVSWPGDLRLAGLQIGDAVTLSEWMLPDALGGRGLDGAAGVVMGVRRDLDAGTVDLRVRLSPSTVAGYAPAALVSSIAGAALTVDTTTLGGAGFADDLNDDGSARADGGASTFAAGDEVQLQEIDTETPTTPFTAYVSGVSGTTVTLSGSPGATWEAIATAGRALLVYQPWSASTASQRRYAFVARASTLQLPSSNPGRRWV